MSVDLAALSQFTVVSARMEPGAEEVIVVGRFSHLRGVWNDGGLLYRGRDDSLHGRLDRVPASADETVEFRTYDASLASELGPGVTYPWVDSYWRAYQVDMILDGRWERREFVATPARYFRLAGVTGWQPEDAALPEGAEDLGVRAGAWDHEHCELCGDRIGADGEATGYVSPGNLWLCESCYRRHAATRDLSFLLRG